MRPADVVEEEQRELGAGRLGDQPQLLADRVVVVVAVDDHRVGRSRGAAAPRGSSRAPARARRALRRGGRAARCGDGSIATTRAPAARRPVDEHAGEVARVGADLDDRPRAGRVEARQQDLREVLERVRPATGIVRVGVDLRLLPLHRAGECIRAARAPDRRLRSTAPWTRAMTTTAASPAPSRRRALAGGRAAARATRASRCSTRCGGSPSSPSSSTTCSSSRARSTGAGSATRSRLAGGLGPTAVLRDLGLPALPPLGGGGSGRQPRPRTRSLPAAASAAHPPGLLVRAHRARDLPGIVGRLHATTGGATTSSSSSTTPDTLGLGIPVAVDAVRRGDLLPRAAAVGRPRDAAPGGARRSSLALAGARRVRARPSRSRRGARRSTTSLPQSLLGQSTWFAARHGARRRERRRGDRRRAPGGHGSAPSPRPGALLGRRARRLRRARRAARTSRTACFGVLLEHCRRRSPTRSCSPTSC